MSFRRFGSLPPELRLQIWEEALSVPTVWAAIRSHNGDGGLRSPARLRFIGPKPYPAGLVCKESLRLREKVFRIPLGGVSTVTETLSRLILGGYWISLKWTVIYLGDATDAMSVLDDLDAENVSRFKHVAMSNLEPVAIPSSRFRKLAKVCQHLAASCPVLRTVIIRREERHPGENEVHCESLSQMADLYAALSEQNQSQTGFGEPYDILHLRALLLEYFRDRPPFIPWPGIKWCLFLRHIFLRDISRQTCDYPTSDGI